MADDIDKANAQAQLILEVQIKLNKKDINPFQNESGQCWECDTPVADNRRWCSIECRDASGL